MDLWEGSRKNEGDRALLLLHSGKKKMTSGQKRTDKHSFAILWVQSRCEPYGIPLVHCLIPLSAGFRILRSYS